MFGDFFTGLGASCRVSGGSKITSAGRAITGFGISMEAKGWLTRCDMLGVEVYLCDHDGNVLVDEVATQAAGRPIFYTSIEAIKTVLANPFSSRLQFKARDKKNVAAVAGATKFQAHFDELCGGPVAAPADPEAPAQPNQQQTPQPTQPQQSMASNEETITMSRENLSRIDDGSEAY